MTEVHYYRHGAFCWADLGTPDPSAARRFYTELLNLRAEDVPTGDGGVYTMLRKDGRAVAAFHRVRAPQAEHGPPQWLVYVNVDDVDRAAARVEPLGGRLLMRPFGLLGSGRMALLEDPTGARLALWQGDAHAGAGVLEEPSAMCWWELNTRDAAAANRFYSELLGWIGEEREVAGNRYTTLFAGEQTVGGVLQMGEAWDDVPSHWMIYFRVERCDESAARAARLGGQVCVPPTDIPPVGRYAVVRDPSGASFSIVQMAGG